MKSPKMDEFGKKSLTLLLMFSLIIPTVTAANDTINASKSISDGETLVSSGGKFALGFFNLGNSTNRYVGIWYNNITDRTYVWVANREGPLTTKSGVLRVIQPGMLALFNHSNGSIIWSSNATRPMANPSAQLLDTGNLVVKDANANDDGAENFEWQSFDYPSDTFLPGLRLGINYVTGVETYLSSWRAKDDPAPGEYTIHLDPTGFPQVVLRRGEDVLFRIGPWNGLQFSGVPKLSLFSSANPLPPIYRTVTMNENEVTFREEMEDPSVLFRAVANPNGLGDSFLWDRQTLAWKTFSFLGGDNCANYSLCGPNGVCNIRNTSVCGCLDGFVLKDGIRSNGCIRTTPFTCEGDVFEMYSGIKLPDSRNSTYNTQRMNIAECKVECSRNCSCTAYTQLDIRSEESGCLFYYGDLIDITSVAQDGQDIYIRMASIKSDSKGKKRVTLIAIVLSVVGTVVVCLSLILFYSRKRKGGPNRRKEVAFSGSRGEEAELPFFELSRILKATDRFADNRRLGEGGFGPVYRGVLENGQEIAVKRLSETSSQGVDQLMNEVILIAKLQHRNLVTLLGCCIERDEKMLIYEYVPKHSLNLILFDQTKSFLLDWQKRFQIINGIAKGLLYLHEDSRLRIIHRDLKASNILLDDDMNPKISDFGLAKSFGGNETEAKTRRIVGTYGYMSPEYAIDGLFSIKSDVFSFGVLVLEIVSGKRNRGFFLEDHSLNLLGHAWTLYKEDKSCKLVDASLGDSFDVSEVLRSIHVALLCVQKSPEDRPSMSSVVSILGNEAALPQAKQPGFFSERDVSAMQSSSSSYSTNSMNQITNTMPHGR